MAWGVEVELRVFLITALGGGEGVEYYVCIRSAF
jgi:hypothetical protein